MVDVVDENEENDVFSNQGQGRKPNEKEGEEKKNVLYPIYILFILARKGKDDFHVEKGAEGPGRESTKPTRYTFISSQGVSVDVGVDMFYL